MAVLLCRSCYYGLLCHVAMILTFVLIHVFDICTGESLMVNILAKCIQCHVAIAFISVFTNIMGIQQGGRGNTERSKPNLVQRPLLG